MRRRVVITGLGVVTSLGCSVPELWRRLLAGESGIRRLQVIDTTNFKVKIGGDIPEFTCGTIVDAREEKRLDRFTQFAIVAGVEAISQASLDWNRVDRNRCGVIMGSGIGGLHEIETQMERLVLRGPDRVSPFTVPKMMLNAAGGNLAIHQGLRGPNYSVATACASATNAMGDALRSIQLGEAEVVVTGGSEAAITRMGVAGFQNMKALSTRNDEPNRASRPFDLNRDGFVLSEGAGMLVFEELEHARRRGAEIFGEVLGFGSSCDAGHITQPDALGTGAADAMRAALLDAKLAPDAIDYINAHGTSTPLGDKAETHAMKLVFGDHVRRVAISSTKSSLGHSLGASGGIELVVTVLALRDQVVPATTNLETPDPECDLDYTPQTPREKKLRIAMSNSFGFGGHNASIICGSL